VVAFMAIFSQVVGEFRREGFVNQYAQRGC
jgi:hypothetical protein